MYSISTYGFRMYGYACQLIGALLMYLLVQIVSSWEALTYLFCAYCLAIAWQSWTYDLTWKDIKESATAAASYLILLVSMLWIVTVVLVSYSIVPALLMQRRY